MARVLVTGATGFIGSHVLRRLADAGHDVVASGRDRARLDALERDGVQVAPADLVSEPLESLVDGAEAVVHCAALASPWGLREAFVRANVEATGRLLDVARRAGVRRFVHLSSPSIYFQLRDQRDIPEAFAPPERWINAYAETKWLSEERVRDAVERGLPAVVLRPRAVFGERDQAIFPRLLALARRGWFPMIGGGKAMVDVTYVGNVAAAVESALKPHVPADGRSFNITNGEPMPVAELLSMLFASLRLQVRTVQLSRGAALALARMAEWAAHVRPGSPEPRLTRYGVGVLGFSQTLDIRAARQQLGYAPHVSVAEGIERFARWWVAHDPH